MLRDISIAMAAGTPEWPGDTPFSCRWTWERARGESVNVSAITASPHVGTHADAPLHVRDGWPASHELPLDAFAGHAVVYGVPGEPRPLGLDDLAGLPGGRIERLLLRTGRSVAEGIFPHAWPALTPDVVRALLARGLRLLGVDAPSVDARESTTLEVHHALFEGGAYNLENLDLRGVPDGEYDLFAFPVKVHGADAAPARAVLRAR
ncbi:MAG TPA: cyclase family protein [Gemmatimonadaceae bacterium]